MVYTKPGIRPGEWNVWTSLGFSDTNRSFNLGQTTRFSDSQQKMRTCRVVDFAVPANYRVKLKGENGDYQDLAKELKAMEHEDDGDTN